MIVVRARLKGSYPVRLFRYWSQTWITGVDNSRISSRCRCTSWRPYRLAPPATLWLDDGCPPCTATAAFLTRRREA